MALETGAGYYNSFDRGTSLADTAYRDVSALMFASLNSHPGNLISRIASAAPVPNRKHEWVETPLNATTVTLVGTDVNGIEDGNGAGDVYITLSAADAALVKVGDILKNRTQNIDELMQVTVNASGVLTVTRGYGASVAGGTAGGTHAVGDKFEVMPVDQESSAIGSDQSRNRLTRYNRTTIFSKAIKLSRNMMLTDMYNVSDEFMWQLEQITSVLKNQINYSFLNSTAVQGGGGPSSTNYASMTGIIPLILQGGNVEATGYTAAASGTVIDPTTSLTYDALSDLIGVIAYTNGNRDGNFVVATGQAQYETIATWPDSQVRRQYGANGQTYGGFVDSVMTKQGISADVILEPDIPVGHLLVLDTSRVQLRPFKNSAMLMYVDDLGFNGNDYKQARLVAEWTLELHNADTAHGIMNALT